MLYAIIVGLIVLLDQFFKYWIVANIELGEQIQLIPGIIHLTYIKNTGAAFSMFENMRWLLLAVTVAAIAAIVVFMVRSKSGKACKILAAAVLGGAVGNAVDRVVYGYVVDMFCTDFITFPVFNVADCFIVVGGILFCVFYILDARKTDKKAAAAEEAPEEPENDGNDRDS